MPSPESAFEEWTWSLHDHVTALAHVLERTCGVMEEPADTVIQCDSNPQISSVLRILSIFYSMLHPVQN